MSRITKAELECMDLQWFGIDEKGQIAVFCSAGVANVPEFVCCDKEKNETLIELFDLLPSISEVEICFEVCKKNMRSIEVANDFSGKGFYYFDSDDNTKKKINVSSLQKYYTINSKPKKPIYFYDLPIEIKELLKDNILSISDFNEVKIIDVKNAY